MLRESDILNRLLRGEIALPPLTVRTTEPRRGSKSADVLAKIAWIGQVFRFVVACRAASSPKAVRDAIGQLEQAKRPGVFPLLIVPWLATDQLRELETQEVSAIDLSGNGVVVVPGKLLVFRTGQPNAFPNSEPLKNVYRGDSSIVSRVFLLRPEYPTVNEILAEIRRRNATVAISTVSKVLKQLAEDLVVERADGGIRLLQAERLMSQLASAYRPPQIRGQLVGRCGVTEGELGRRMKAAVERRSLDCVLTGATSTTRYAVMAREPIVSLYCSMPPQSAAKQLGIAVEPDARFPDIELVWTDDQTVYFDRRIEREGCYASPVQVWLELVAGDKRQRDVADQVKTLILESLQPQGEKRQA